MNVRDRIVKDQKRISRIVTGKFPAYYLAGGTALAFYLGHRFSEDLDFFSPRYDPAMADKIMRYIEDQTGYSFKRGDEVHRNIKTAGMKVFYLNMGSEVVMKVDFVGMSLGIRLSSKAVFSLLRIFISGRSLRLLVSGASRLRREGRSPVGARA
jgi:hypothetical protein